ncbi:MAG: hypothetical protein HY300_18305 [Verrucomicrobia bacterium]|nr:hypothetical protein [Verrucomicrobiota bacterium]
MTTKFQIAALVCSLSAVVSFAQSPSVTHVMPSAAMPGKTTEVSVFGSGLGGATELWTSFGAKGESVQVGSAKSDAGKAVFKLTLPASQPVGIGALRVVTSNGVSSLLPFMVDDLPTVTDNGTNKFVASAQPLTLPVAVDGSCDELARSFYRFIAKKGDRVSVEVVARRLGSALDPVARLFDARGRELGWSDDDPSVGRDSRFIAEIPVSGEYFIEVRDIEYRGGATFRYRLRVGHFPLVNFPFPFAAKAGSAGAFALVGKGLDAAKPIFLAAPKSALSDRVWLNAKSSRGSGTGFASLLVTGLNEITEIEPNDTNTLAQKITVPAAINGRFAKPHDRDWFEFTVAKGERLLFASRTRSLGSPCDAYMELFKADGTRLASTKPTAVEEAAITNTFTEAGTYRLMVEEVNRLGGPELAYRIEIAPQPAFSLSVDTDKVEAPAGGSFTVKVACERRSFDGPITLACQGIEGATVEDNVIAEKKNEAQVKIKLPSTEQPGRVLPLRLTGRAKVGETEQAAPVSTMPALRKVFTDAIFAPLHVPPELDGLIAIGVKPTEAK